MYVTVAIGVSLLVPAAGLVVREWNTVPAAALRGSPSQC
jgi:hypothetical protein